jgi:hypothetical protein
MPNLIRPAFRFICNNSVVDDYANDLTCFAKLDLIFPALFLCITSFFANLSSIEHTPGYNSAAAFLSVVKRNFFTAFLVVLA